MVTTSPEPHTIVQAWVSVELAEELKAGGRAQGRTLSCLVRDAREELRQNTGELEAERVALRRGGFGG